MNKTPSLTAIILTYNEEMHLQRCLDSLKRICGEIVVIDSFSSDRTKEIAVKNGARFYQNKFSNHANQLNWGIEFGEIKTDWIIRVDADEYISEELSKNIKINLSTINSNVHGIRVKRLVYFFDKPLKNNN